MNLKKSIAIGLAATALFASFGCGDSGKQSGSGSPPSASMQQNKPLDEATIKALAKKLESPNMAEKKEAFPLEELPTHILIKTSLTDENSNVFSQPIKIDNLSLSDIKQNGEYASVQASFKDAANQQHNDLWIFRRLNGEWKFDPFGIKTAKPLKVSGYDGVRFETAANIGYTYENDPVLIFDIRAKTSTVYQLGGWSQPSYVMVTDKGEFPPQNATTFLAPAANMVAQITSAQPFRLYLPFKGATGTPKALRITGFNELDSRGFAVDHDKNQVVTFTLSE